MKQGCVYIVTNLNNTVLYTGVTSNLEQRVYQHKNKTFSGFTAKYNCSKLVFFEVGDDIESCILREKQIKAGSRKKKIELIETLNPNWKDLSEELF
ncbi:MAG: GIY-YIG nuclease family protein [Marinicella sp.]